jgi:hypothetical protein
MKVASIIAIISVSIVSTLLAAGDAAAGQGFFSALQKEHKKRSQASSPLFGTALAMGRRGSQRGVRSGSLYSAEGRTRQKLQQLESRLRQKGFVSQRRSDNFIRRMDMRSSKMQGRLSAMTMRLAQKSRSMEMRTRSLHNWSTQRIAKLDAAAAVARKIIPKKVADKLEAVATNVVKDVFQSNQAFRRRGFFPG